MIDWIALVKSCTNERGGNGGGGGIIDGVSDTAKIANMVVTWTEMRGSLLWKREGGVENEVDIFSGGLAVQQARKRKGWLSFYVSWGSPMRRNSVCDGFFPKIIDVSITGHRVKQRQWSYLASKIMSSSLRSVSIICCVNISVLYLSPCHLTFEYCYKHVSRARVLSTPVLLLPVQYSTIGTLSMGGGDHRRPYLFNNFQDVGKNGGRETL